MAMGFNMAIIWRKAAALPDVEWLGGARGTLTRGVGGATADTAWWLPLAPDDPPLPPSPPTVDAAATVDPSPRPTDKAAETFSNTEETGDPSPPTGTAALAALPVISKWLGGTRGTLTRGVRGATADTAWWLPLAPDDPPPPPTVVQAVLPGVRGSSVGVPVLSGLVMTTLVVAASLVGVVVVGAVVVGVVVVGVVVVEKKGFKTTLERV